MEFDVPLSFYFASMVPYAALAWAAYLAWRCVRAYERRSIRRRDLVMISTRVRLLEDSVEEVERRMARSEDVHRFTTSVLAGRAAIDNRALAERR